MPEKCVQLCLYVNKKRNKLPPLYFKSYLNFSDRISRSVLKNVNDCQFLTGKIVHHFYGEG